MASRKSLITALAAAGLISGLGFAYAQATDQAVPADMNQQRPQQSNDTSMPAVQPVQPEAQVQTPIPANSPPMATPQPQYNDAPVSAPMQERAPRADRN